MQHLVNFQKELEVGHLFYIDSHVSAIGTKSLTTVHRMFNANGDFCASDEIKSVYFDLAKRVGIVLPEVIRSNAEASMSHA